MVELTISPPLWGCNKKELCPRRSWASFPWIFPTRVGMDRDVTFCLYEAKHFPHTRGDQYQ